MRLEDIVIGDKEKEYFIRNKKDGNYYRVWAKEITSKGKVRVCTKYLSNARTFSVKPQRIFKKVSHDQMKNCLETEQNLKHVKIRQGDGTISQMIYFKLIRHEESIIEDNIFYALKNDYTDKEIQEYEESAMKELETLKRKIQENPDIVLKLYKRTERYFPENEIPTDYVSPH